MWRLWNQDRRDWKIKRLPRWKDKAIRVRMSKNGGKDKNGWVWG